MDGIGQMVPSDFSINVVFDEQEVKHMNNFMEEIPEHVAPEVREKCNN